MNSKQNIKLFANILFFCISFITTNIYATNIERDPNMTKWGPKLSDDEIIAISKLSKQQLVKMLKTDDTLHAYTALKMLKENLDENFDLLLEIAAETRGDIIVEGLIVPVKQSSDIKEKRKVDKFINFLNNQLKLKKPSVSADQAIRSIAKTVYLTSAQESKWYSKIYDVNDLPIPYANDRAITILKQQLKSSNSHIRAAALDWLSKVAAQDLSKTEEINKIFEAQIKKEESLNKTKEDRERMVKYAQETLNDFKKKTKKLRQRPSNNKMMIISPKK